MTAMMDIWKDTAQPWEGRRQEIIDLLCREEYGFLPPKPETLTWETVSEDDRFCAGKAVLRQVILTASWADKRYSFPIYVCLKNSAKPVPFVVNIGFAPDIVNQYLPIEELCDLGISVLYFCYEDISSDNWDFSNGLAGLLFPDGKRNPDSPGKLALWAWAAQRVMDYARSLACLDFAHAGVAGHSRLGKTALLAGAADQRFTHVFANESGCCGAAVSRGKEGETIRDICRQFGYWFCESFQQYAGHEEDLPFDQHFLLGAIAPRKVCVGSAAGDTWAGPMQEFHACVLAAEVYEKLGLSGLNAPDRLPVPGDCFQTGHIGYHLRGGTHYFSREDWQKYAACLVK